LGTVSFNTGIQFLPQFRIRYAPVLTVSVMVDADPPKAETAVVLTLGANTLKPAHILGYKQWSISAHSTISL